MNLDYAISTFCFGDRYYQQTNRMIESFESIPDVPEIFIITDSTESIKKTSFVKVKNISDYNKKYVEYKKNYYDFDFSVKRFSLLFAFENNYNNVILTDTDVVVNEPLFKKELILNTFIENSIAGQTCYNFNDEIKNNSMLGRRFLHYEKAFNVSFDKNHLISMPEDCIQFISIPEQKKFSFLKTWDECIKIKDRDSLMNTPAGNIDEMCFSALYNNVKCSNNSNKTINLLIAKHDKWY
jgi:hypothetical protein